MGKYRIPHSRVHMCGRIFPNSGILVTFLRNWINAAELLEIQCLRKKKTKIENTPDVWRISKSYGWPNVVNVTASLAVWGLEKSPPPKLNKKMSYSLLTNTCDRKWEDNSALWFQYQTMLLSAFFFSQFWEHRLGKFRKGADSCCPSMLAVKLPNLADVVRDFPILGMFTQFSGTSPVLQTKNGGYW